jgi:hypothetical protein
MIKNERATKTCTSVRVLHRKQNTHYIHLIRKHKFDAEFLNFSSTPYRLNFIFELDIVIYHILGSEYAEFAHRDIGDVTITHISTVCKTCISISARVQKMHINDLAIKTNVTKNKSTVNYFRILSSFTTANLALIVYDK